MNPPSADAAEAGTRVSAFKRVSPRGGAAVLGPPWIAEAIGPATVDDGPSTKCRVCFCIFVGRCGIRCLLSDVRKYL